MAERDWSADPLTLTIPPGAGPNDPAIVIGADVPAELTAYYAVFFFTIYAAILYRFDGDDYMYDALINQGPGVNPLISRGVVIGGTVSGMFDVGAIGSSIAGVVSGTFGSGRLQVGTPLFPDGLFTVFGQSTFLDTAAGTVVVACTVKDDTVNRFAVQADGKHEWGSGAAARDTNLYRGAADVLSTDDQFSITRGAAGSTAATAKVTGDSVDRFAVGADGLHEWGSGAAARDTNLYRTAANTLQTDDSLIVNNDLTVNDDIIAAKYLPVQTVNGTDDAAFTQTTYSTNQSCGHAFVAPVSGQVRVDWAVRMESNTAGVRVLASFNIRAGGTVGSGALQFTAGDGTAIESPILDRIQAGSSYVHSGLTNGTTYNVEIVYKVSAAGNGDMFDQRVITTPVLG